MGIGTISPTETLHVFANDVSPFEVARVLVENAQSSTGSREMFALKNNGGTRFTMENTNSGFTWAFAQDALGRFTFSEESTGGPEFFITPTGRVVMGPGASINFDLRPNGNLTIAGTLSQSSDENIKDGFEEVDNNEVLDKILEMPVRTWHFNFDNPDLRHMGPTAQDFQAAFGLGENDTTIAPVDGIGVSLVAIKALKQQLDEKDVAIDKLAQQVEKLTRLVENAGIDE